MENDTQISERLERAATLLERTLAWLEDRAISGDIAKISATIDAGKTGREEELSEKLAAAEKQIAELKDTAAACTPAPDTLNPIRRTMQPSTTEMLAKHGIGEGPVDVRTLDAALAGLSLEQRIAVKSQLLRAGALS